MKRLFLAWLVGLALIAAALVAMRSGAKADGAVAIDSPSTGVVTLDKVNGRDSNLFATPQVPTIGFFESTANFTPNPSCAANGTAGMIKWIDTVEASGTASVTMCFGTSTVYVYPDTGSDVIANAELLIGSGAGTGAYVGMSGDCSLLNTGTIECTQADALETNPADCSSNQFATTIAANGDLTCSAVAFNQVATGTSAVALHVGTGGSLDATGSGTIAATTAGALAANPSDCSATQFATTIAASGNLTCAAITDADVPNSITVDNATTATALASNPTDCGANQFATTIAASGNLTCAAITDADVPNTITVNLAASASDLTCTNCIGATEIDESTLSLTDDDLTNNNIAELADVITTGDDAGYVLVRNAGDTAYVSVLLSGDVLMDAAGDVTVRGVTCASGCISPSEMAAVSFGAFSCNGSTCATTAASIGTTEIGTDGVGSDELSSTAIVPGDIGEDDLPDQTLAQFNANISDQDVHGYREHATDCTALTDGKTNELCRDQDDGKLWLCVPTSGDCSGSEWKPYGLLVRYNGSDVGQVNAVEYTSGFASISITSGKATIAPGSSMTMLGSTLEESELPAATVFTDKANSLSTGAQEVDSGASFNVRNAADTADVIACGDTTYANSCSIPTLVTAGVNITDPSGDDFVLSLASGALTLRADATTPADGSDTSSVSIASGGSVAATRGAFIQVYGNEAASNILGGKMYLQAGDDSTSEMQALVGSGSTYAIRLDVTDTNNLVVTQPTVGSQVLNLVSTATNDDPNYSVTQARAATTDATVTTLQSVTVASNTMAFVRANVIARCTAGASCTITESAAYVVSAVCKNNAGTTSIVGAQDIDVEIENDDWTVAIDCDDASDTARVRVTGAGTSTITWHATVTAQSVGS